MQRFLLKADMVYMDHVNCRGEFGYEFLCTTISKYIIILVKSSCVTEANTGKLPHTWTWKQLQ